MKNKYEAVCGAYVWQAFDQERQDKNGGKEGQWIMSDKLDADIKQKISDIQYGLDVEFGLSYEIMADACNIIDELDADKLANADFWAEADSRCNVYTAVRLSWLSIHNEEEISNLMADESITSIAQACAIWYAQKVQEACEALTDLINND